jgi:hypothetical protein
MGLWLHRRRALGFHRAALPRNVRDFRTAWARLGILAIVEQQVDKGAGHRYLQQRIGSGDGIGIGFRKATADEGRLVIVPRIKHAKFGRKKSGFHMPFPSVGYVENRSAGYRWVPVSYQLNL